MKFETYLKNKISFIENFKNSKGNEFGMVPLKDLKDNIYNFKLFIMLFSYDIKNIYSIQIVSTINSESYKFADDKFYTNIKLVNCDRSFFEKYGEEEYYKCLKYIKDSNKLVKYI